MDRLHLKFCGLKTREDIDCINKLFSAGGAVPDYVGFVMAESRRRIAAADALSLRQRLVVGIQTVAVLVNAPLYEAAELVRQGIADVLQLHGDEDGAYIRKLRQLVSCPLIRAIRLPVLLRDRGCPDRNRQRSVALQALWEAQDADYYLFDASVPGMYGGSGQTPDSTLLGELPIDKPFFLAGGLTAESVGGAISFVRRTKTLSSYFYGVDVSGGIETDGRKDPRKMQRFAQALWLTETPSARLLRRGARSSAGSHSREDTGGEYVPSDIQV